MKKTLSNKYATFWIEDGILFFTYHPAVVLNLSVAEKVVVDRLRFQEDKTFPVLCDTRGLKDTEKAARDFLAKEGSILTSAVAFLVNPPVSKAMTDFYVKANKPVTPTRVFSEKYDAVKFLEPFKKK